MVNTTVELLVDLTEVFVAAAIILGYGYVALIEGQRIDDRLLEGLIISAALVMFGDQYQERLASRNIDASESSESQ